MTRTIMSCFNVLCYLTELFGTLLQENNYEVHWSGQRFRMLNGLSCFTLGCNQCLSMKSVGCSERDICMSICSEDCLTSNR
mmetsp:Transcript_18958/g.52173  ORF Transcript_18958/g.52173 Transcript_18958/m.52173 type:complete len:81 (+) Transcript_18958:112-354(+)